jgi:hypothetical protein
MRTYLILVLLLLLGLSVGASAQYFPGPYVGAGSWIGTVTSAGAVTTIWNNPGTVYGIAMDAQNKNLICGETSLQALLSLDPTTGAYTTILADANVLASPRGLVLDQDGNLIVASDATTGYGLFKISGNQITTLITTLSMGITGTFSGGLVRDVDTGDYVVQVYDTTLGHPMYSVAADGSTFTTVHTGIPAGTPGWNFTQDVASGYYYVGGKDTGGIGGYLLEVQKNGATTILATVAADASAYLVPMADRASAAAPRVVSPYYNTNIYYTDLATGTVTTTAIAGNFVSPRSGTIVYQRNIQTVLTAPGKWDIFVSFPTLPSKVYALVATLSGIRPGVTMPDSRRILLNPDPLTYATLVDALLPIFNDGGNLLDANGAATGSLDLTTLPPLGGVAMHLLVVVESTPGVIAAVSEPFLMRLP